MEKVSTGERESLADPKRRGGLAQSKIDEYDDDPRLLPEAPRVDQAQGSGAHGGPGEGGGPQAGDGEHQRSHGDGLVSDGEGCRLLAGFTAGHPCSHCRGGGDYQLCTVLRGE